MSNTIDYSIIAKRSRCINSLEESKGNNEKAFNDLDNKFSESNISDKIKSGVLTPILNMYIESMCYVNSASNYYQQPFYLVQEFSKYDNSIAEKIVNEYNNRILPYVKDLSYIDEALERYDFSEDMKKSISETAKQYNVADRILANHDRISKRFNIELEVARYNNNLKDIVESCCNMIDTYTIKPYQKLNLCIEEMVYLFGKNNIKVDKKDMVNYVTEYFLLRSPFLSSNDLKGYKVALTESYCLKDEDLDKVKYIYQGNNKEYYCSIDNDIKLFLASQEKNKDNLFKVSQSLLKTTKLDILTNLDRLLYLIWDVTKSGVICDHDECINILHNTLDILLNRLSDNSSLLSDCEFSGEDLNSIVDSINKVYNIIIIRGTDSGDIINIKSRFKRELNDYIIKIGNIYNFIYSESNLESLQYVNSNSLDPIPLNEFKIFKFQNLIKASINLDRHLKEKAKKIREKIGVDKIVPKLKDIIFGEAVDNMYSYIGEDNKADICVAQYYINECDESDLNNIFSDICKDFNYTLDSQKNTARAYYIINPGVVEIHIKDATPLLVDNEIRSKIEESYDESLDLYVEQFAIVESVLDSFDKMGELNDIREDIMRFYENDNLTLEHFDVLMEAMSLSNFEFSDVKLFAERFNKYRSNILLESGADIIDESKQINSIVDKWVKEDNAPLMYQLEAYQIIKAVLEAGPEVKKPKINAPKINKPKIGTADQSSKEEDKEEKDSKNPFKGININSIKLYLEGLKGKMKDMSQKEKEISRNLDNNFRRLVKGMKDALISDRREAIIKGSVIPSFSKCCKIAIGLAGLGLLTGNPMVPLMVAIGGFAMSKKLTEKERILLLDEIETELDVVEKEIAMAESKNQMKKYRTLLNYKKDLQRQYQRIRYNVRVGKDLLPGSTIGLKNTNQ